MQLIKPSVKIEHITPAALELIELAGRTCYKSESKITEESSEAFVRMIIERGHESVLEHASVSVRFICDRGVSHEIIRHRIASFSQESTRYVNYANRGIEFIVPVWMAIPTGEVTQNNCTNYGSTKAELVYLQALLNAEWAYNVLIEEGWRPEHARSVLPNSLKTEIVMTANLREWRHFFKLRCSTAAHPQMREVALEALRQFQQSPIGIVFEGL